MTPDFYEQVFSDIHLDFIRTQTIQAIDNPYFEARANDYLRIKELVYNIYPFLIECLEDATERIKNYNDNSHLAILIFLKGQFKGFITKDGLVEMNEDKFSIHYSDLENFILYYLDPFINKIEKNIYLKRDSSAFYSNTLIDLYRTLVMIKSMFTNRIKQCQKKVSAVKWMLQFFPIRKTNK